MKDANPSIEIVNYGVKQTLYYKNTRLLTMLQYFPFIQLGLISLFLGVGYWAFSSARRAEQNQVWVGMSKETAHQLGTPISSMVAWYEHLKIEAEGNDYQINILNEFRKDIGRLELIAERFSKIGSQPTLESVIIILTPRKHPCKPVSIHRFLIGYWKIYLKTHSMLPTEKAPSQQRYLTMKVTCILTFPIQGGAFLPVNSRPSFSPVTAPKNVAGDLVFLSPNASLRTITLAGFL